MAEGDGDEFEFEKERAERLKSDIDQAWEELLEEDRDHVTSLIQETDDDTEGDEAEGDDAEGDDEE